MNAAMPQTSITSFVRSTLRSFAEPERIAQMQAYLKTDQPFLGVMGDGRKETIARTAAAFPVADAATNERQIADLWAGREREMKYVAVGLARKRRKLVSAQSLPLYERMVREGAWWDLVDEIAIHLVGVAALADSGAVRPAMDAWISDPDMWIRRTALIFQNRHRARTDEGRLFRYCLACADEREFFIRKAIGWALREHARTRPEAVRAFVEAHRHRLSGLSIREATKHLGIAGSPGPGGP